MGFKLERVKADKTATETAAHMGVSRMTIFSWEKGLTCPCAERLLKLATFYGCSVEDLLKDNPKGVQ